jgi:hypothetical protein
MTKIVIEIKSCKDCPFFEKRNPYSTDGFDRMEDWHCTKKDKKIQGSVEWHEESKIEVPEWCPISLKEELRNAFDDGAESVNYDDLQGYDRDQTFEEWYSKQNKES